MPYKTTKTIWPLLSFSRDGGIKTHGKEFQMQTNPIKTEEMSSQDKEFALDESLLKVNDFGYFSILSMFKNRIE
jgi:hypothetical protein